MADRLLFTGHRVAQRNAARIAAGECAAFVPRSSTVGAARQYCASCTRHRDHHTEEPIQVNVDWADLATPRPGAGQATHVDRLNTSTRRDDATSTASPATAGEEPYIALAASVADAVRRGKSDEAIALLETVATLDHALGNPKATTPRQANAEAGDQYIRRLIQGPHHLFMLCAEVGDVEVFTALEKFVLNPPAHPGTIAGIRRSFVRCEEATVMARQNQHPAMVEHLQTYKDVGATLDFF